MQSQLFDNKFADESELQELVKKPCSISDVTATRHLISPLRDKIEACDGNTSTFYHSVFDRGVAASPFFTLNLGGTFLIETITVVNVHTGAYCKTHGKHCTERINGAKVEVLNGWLNLSIIIQVLAALEKCYEVPCYADHKTILRILLIKNSNFQARKLSENAEG